MSSSKFHSAAALSDKRLRDNPDVFRFPEDDEERARWNEHHYEEADGHNGIIEPTARKGRSSLIPPVAADHRPSNHSPSTRKASFNVVPETVGVQHAPAERPRRSSKQLSREEIVEILLRRKDIDENFGFEITGGVDIGRPLTISDVHPNGPASLSGLRKRDIIDELEGIDARELTHSEAVQLLKNAPEVRMIVRRFTNNNGSQEPVRKINTFDAVVPLPPPDTIKSDPSRNDVETSSKASSHRSKQSQPEQPITNHAYAWIDCLNRQPCSPPPDEEQLAQSQATIKPPEREAVLLVSEDVHLGLLIRGGMEYGLGIYVTGVDKASAAEAAQLMVGDQILSVNNYDFRRITHTRAVRVLRTHRHMNMKLRHVGKLPFARRLSPSSSVPQMANGSAAGKGLMNTGATILDTEDELELLIRDATEDGMNFGLIPAYNKGPNYGITGTNDADIELEMEKLLNLTASRNSESNEEGADQYWMGLIQQNAEILLQDPSQTEALMYLIEDYLSGSSGSVCVDALVLSLFPLIDSIVKLQLVDDIRNIIKASDISVYDSLTLQLRTLWMSPGVQSTKSNYTMKLASFGEVGSPNFSNQGSPSLPLKSALKRTSSLVLPPELIQPPPATPIVTPSPMYTSLQVLPTETPQANVAPAPPVAQPPSYMQNMRAIPVHQANAELFSNNPYTAAFSESFQRPVSPNMGQSHPKSAGQLVPAIRLQRPSNSSLSRNGPGFGHNDESGSPYAHPKNRLHLRWENDHVQSSARSWPGQMRSESFHKMTEQGHIAMQKSASALHGERRGTIESSYSIATYSEHGTADSRRASMVSERGHPTTVQEPLGNRPQTLVLDKIGPAKVDQKTPAVIEKVVVKKNAPFLGLAIEGGTDTPQTLPRIINIQPNGCAHINGNLKVGHVILSINGNKMDNLNHAQAVKLIKDIFLDSSTKTMEFTVKEVNKLPSAS